jgi:hypothetical protein
LKTSRATILYPNSHPSHRTPFDMAENDWQQRILLIVYPILLSMWSLTKLMY